MITRIETQRLPLLAAKNLPLDTQCLYWLYGKYANKEHSAVVNDIEEAAVFAFTDIKSWNCSGYVVLFKEEGLEDMAPLEQAAYLMKRIPEVKDVWEGIKRNLADQGFKVNAPSELRQVECAVLLWSSQNARSMMEASDLGLFGNICTNLKEKLVASVKTNPETKKLVSVLRDAGY